MGGNMYLISLYFDNETQEKLRTLMERVARRTENRFMQDNHVPPHITVAAVETKCEDELLIRVEKIANNLKCDKIQFVSVGTFSTRVIFVQPFLNEYLQQLSITLTQKLEQIDETILSSYYKPFNWLPHCTIAKQLSKDEMQKAFSELLQHFTPVNGYVTQIGVSKTNPHRDLRVWELYKDNNRV